MAERNWGAVTGTATTWVETQWKKLLKFYQVAFGLTIAGAIVLMIIGVNLNQNGYAVVNFSIATAFIVVWIFFTYQPAVLLTVFGVGGLDGLPKDWSINQLLSDEGNRLPDLKLSNVASKGFDLVRSFTRYTAHVAYFAIVIFTVLGTWYIKDTVAILPILVLLVGIGYWAVLSKAVAKWYYLITRGILIVSLAMFLFQGFIGEKKETSWTATKLPAPGEVRPPSLPKIRLPWEKTTWVVVESLDCSNNKIKEEASLGWCRTKGSYGAGNYRFRLRDPANDIQWKMVMPDKTLTVGPDGIALYLWGTRPFVADFKNQALVKNERVGSLIARAGYGSPAFFALKEFTLEEGEKKRPEVTVNMLQLPSPSVPHQFISFKVQLEREE